MLYPPVRQSVCREYYFLPDTGCSGLRPNLYGDKTGKRACYRFRWMQSSWIPLFYRRSGYFLSEECRYKGQSRIRRITHSLFGQIRNRWLPGTSLVAFRRATGYKAWNLFCFRVGKPTSRLFPIVYKIWANRLFPFLRTGGKWWGCSSVFYPCPFSLASRPPLLLEEAFLSLRDIRRRNWIVLL